MDAIEPVSAQRTPCASMSSAQARSHCAQPAPSVGRHWTGDMQRADGSLAWWAVNWRLARDLNRLCAPSAVGEPDTLSAASPVFKWQPYSAGLGACKRARGCFSTLGVKDRHMLHRLDLLGRYTKICFTLQALASRCSWTHPRIHDQCQSSAHCATTLMTVLPEPLHTPNEMISLR